MNRFGHRGLLAYALALALLAAPVAIACSDCCPQPEARATMVAPADCCGGCGATVDRASDPASLVAKVVVAAGSAAPAILPPAMHRAAMRQFLTAISVAIHTLAGPSRTLAPLRR